MSGIGKRNEFVTDTNVLINFLGGQKKMFDALNGKELPDDYKNKTVELIILETDEVASLVRGPESDYTKLYGSMNLGTSMIEIDKPS